MENTIGITARRAGARAILPLSAKLSVTAVAALLVFGAHATPTATTLYDLNFDDNKTPAGWSIYNANWGRNYGFSSGRFFAGQVDTTTFLYAPIDGAKYKSVTVEWDGNVAPVYWGQATGAQLSASMPSYSSDYIYTTLGKAGFGINRVDMATVGGWPTQPAKLINLTSPGIPYGDYHLTSTFTDGAASLQVTNKVTGQTFSTGSVAVPGIKLSDMHDVALVAGTTTGATAWIDNVKVTAQPIVTSTPPDTRTLAQLAVDVYVNSSAESQISIRNGYNLVGASAVTNTGLKVNTYQKDDQFVVAIRGTNPANNNDFIKNVLADTALTHGGTVNSQIVSYSTSVAKVVRDLISSGVDPSKITLTGHSLGGALAQVIGGSVGGLNVVTFDAPGSRQILDQTWDAGDCGLSRCDGSLKSIIKQIIPATPSTVLGQSRITNFRLAGDQVSISGEQVGDTVTVHRPGGDTFDASTFLTKVTSALLLHDMNTLAIVLGSTCPSAELQAGVCVAGFDGDTNYFTNAGFLAKVVTPFLYTNCVFPDGSPQLGIFSTASAMRSVALHCLRGSAALVEKSILVDPPPGYAYDLSIEAGSPYLSLLDLPLFDDVLGWQIQYHNEFGWSSEYKQMGFGTFQLEGDVDQVSFVPLDSSGRFTFNPHEFVFGLGGKSDGSISFVLTAISPEASVPEPSMIALLVAAGLGLVGRARPRQRLC